MSTIRPVDLRNINTVTATRADELHTLIALASGIGRGHSTQLDMLGQLRLVELQAQSVRRALVREAYTSGFTGQELADTLALSLAELEKRYEK